MNQSSTQLVPCPVCHTMIDDNNLVMEYQNRKYAFCSLQCRQKFESSPHLYRGRQGEVEPKKSGFEIVKTRTLKLTRPLTEDQSTVVETELAKMTGIRNVSAEKQQVFVRYDLLEATTEQIESTLEQSGFKLKNGLGVKMKRGFVHYLEKSELASLEHSREGSRH